MYLHQSVFGRSVALAVLAVLVGLATDTLGQQQNQTQLPLIEGPRPWTEKPILDDPDRFHIAIMTDRTGGHRPGIWSQAIEQVNLMRPEFVMSVGDLIEGYSDDAVQVEGQWHEFLDLTAALQMKFFFVAGNHDVTNPMMHEIWRKKFGPQWYSFDHKGVHFLCISSEDPVTRVGEAQLDWIRQDLEEHSDARWTLVFLHKPLWVYAEREVRAGNQDPTNWKLVEELLKDRPHTVFAGHVHHYVQYDRNGTHYYSFATTGGSSRLRGRAYGEFDHVTWLTMERDGPRVANLMLDGVTPGSVVTERSIGRYRDFLARSTFEVQPILINQGDSLSSGRIRVNLTNRFDRPVLFEGALYGFPLTGLTLQPALLSQEVAPGETGVLESDFAFSNPIDLRRLAGAMLKVKLTAKDDPPLHAELSKAVIIDRRFYLRHTEITPDGLLGEWALAYEIGRPGDVFGAGEQWQGPNDASARFSVAQSEAALFVGCTVADDRVLIDRDHVVIVIDPRPLRQRTQGTALPTDAIVIRLAPPDDAGSCAVEVIQPAGRSAMASGKGNRTESGFDFELEIPRSLLGKYQEGFESMQMAMVLHDVDEPNDEECWISWRSARDFRQHNRSFGHLFAR